MTLSELKQCIKNVGLFPIHVEGWPDTDKPIDAYFAGTLDEFLEAAKALRLPAVFVYASKLDADDFLYSPDALADEYEPDVDNESNEVEDAIDLTLVNPLLGKFKKYLDQDTCFLLNVKAQGISLNLVLSEVWWAEFVDERDATREKVDKDQAKTRENIAEQREQKIQKLLAGLSSLLDDPEFVRLPTQRGMKAYAIEKFPDLETVDPLRITTVIQKLSDKAAVRRRR